MKGFKEHWHLFLFPRDHRMAEPLAHDTKTSCTVSTLTTSNAPPGSCLGPQRPGIMFRTNLHTSSGIYAPTGLKAHVRAGSALMGKVPNMCARLHM